MSTRGWNVLSKVRALTWVIVLLAAGFLLGRCSATDRTEGPTDGHVEVAE